MPRWATFTSASGRGRRNETDLGVATRGGEHSAVGREEEAPIPRIRALDRPPHLPCGDIPGCDIPPVVPPCQAGPCGCLRPIDEMLSLGSTSLSWLDRITTGRTPSRPLELRRRNLARACEGTAMPRVEHRSVVNGTNPESGGSQETASGAREPRVRSCQEHREWTNEPTAHEVARNT